jgi:hypothetical protein
VTSHSTPQLTTGDDDGHGHIAHERPEQWGWHREFRTGRQVMGWISVAIVLLMITATHYNLAGALALSVTAIILAAGLIWDLRRRRTQWRH